MSDYSDRLRVLRNYYKMNQQEFSAKFNVNQKTWSRYETGATFLQEEVIKILVYEMGVSFDWLLTGKGNMFITERAENGEYLFEVPLLSKEEAYSLQRIEEPAAHSGKYPDIVLVPVSDRLKEFSTDLRAIRVFTAACLQY